MRFLINSLFKRSLSLLLPLLHSFFTYTWFYWHKFCTSSRHSVSQALEHDHTRSQSIVHRTAVKDTTDPTNSYSSATPAFIPFRCWTRAPQGSSRRHAEDAKNLFCDISFLVGDSSVPAFQVKINPPWRAVDSLFHFYLFLLLVNIV